MLKYFIDPILKAPTIGCICMCIACALVGVIIFVRKESLLGETLSHSTYPGIMTAALIASFFPQTKFNSVHILLGAAIFSCIALWLLEVCKRHFKMSADSALCFILTGFFGVGLTISSFLQNINAKFYKQALIYLFGQAATITNQYLYFYVGLVLVIILFILLFHRGIQIANFDPIFAKCVGIQPKAVQILNIFLIISAIIIGIRSIGLFLLSGMFIAPAIAARQWTHKLNKMFVFSAFFGFISGFLGIYLSVEISSALAKSSSEPPISLATGPMIILISAIITLFSLMFAPKRGFVIRFYRRINFKYQCLQENILKSLWLFESSAQFEVNAKDIYAYQNIPSIYFYFLIAMLLINGKIKKTPKGLILSDEGKKKAARIIRLHRLWEVYLAYLGLGKEKVHHNAEEMEHIITPEIERKLMTLMQNPKRDPHNQPIPEGELV